MSNEEERAKIQREAEEDGISINIRSSDVPASKDELRKLLLMVESDINVKGWDQPLGFYAVVGKPEDPRLDLMTTLQGHPCNTMQAFWDHGVRLRSYIMGLAVASEGWGHLSLDEVRKVSPDVVEGIEAATKVLFPEMTEEEQAKEARRVYSKAVNRYAPSSVPPEYRKEIRSVQAVFRDGSIVAAQRTRGRDGEEDEVLTLGFDESSIGGGGGRVADFMHKWLTDERPEDHPGQDLNAEEEANE